MTDRPEPGHALSRLLQGVNTFSRQLFPAREGLFRQLAMGQAPHTLFITCADARISPELITHSRPGDLFVCRNIGNIVPASGDMPGGVSAVVEYAVLALEVRQIVLCGHSHCGAMQSLLGKPDALENMPTVRRWLENAEAARAILAASPPEDDPVLRLAEHNVRLQLAHLRTHPAVAAALARRTLGLQGWMYDIGQGTIRVLDTRDDRFHPSEHIRLQLQEDRT